MIHTIWEDFLKIIKEEAGSRVVDTWFKAVSLKQWDSIKNIAFIQAPNAFVKDWIQKNYTLLIQLHLARLLNVDKLTIVLNHAREKSDSPLTTQKIIPARHVPIVNIDKNIPVKSSLIKHNGHVNHSYSFDTFVVGPSNSLAYAAAQAVSEKPGLIYNPLFIYGGSGLGKTHLLHAIGNEIKKKHKKVSILYQTADRFVTEFINAIRFDKIHRFKAKYKTVDVLLIDDIQFISNKEQTQEAFFHIFNSLYEFKKQLVFSSDTFPQNIKGLAERLQSRLSWGLEADVKAPTVEIKIAILKRKAELSNIDLFDDVAHFIASRVTSNIRELEGSLIRVLAFSALTRQPITLELAKKVLFRLQEPGQHNNVNFERILKCISKYYPYDIKELKSKNRNKDLSFARQVAMFLMKRMTDKSLRDIGMFFGGRDHTTVKHAYQKVSAYAQNHVEFQEQLKHMQAEISR